MQFKYISSILLSQSHCVDAGAKYIGAHERAQSWKWKLTAFQDYSCSGEDDICESLEPKYWVQRLRLFSKWNLGIQMDQTAWFSVTPESIARHHAQRCASTFVKGSHFTKYTSLTILDACCGVGGNTIQFAIEGLNVLAYDIRMETLNMVSVTKKL